MTNQCFNAPGPTELVRRIRYKKFVDMTASSVELELIRNALQRGQLTRTRHFEDEIEYITGLRVTGRGRGRPAKIHANEITEEKPALVLTRK